MKILLTGAAGQLGQALRAAAPSDATVIATSRQGGAGLEALDLGDASACRMAVETHRPDWVLNAGAYTAVDKAESEPELAHAVNAMAPRAFAEALKTSGGRLLQISTDFVFNGSQGTPYRPEQNRTPLGVYGASKAAGEDAIQELFTGDARSLILRTSWVMDPSAEISHYHAGLIGNATPSAWWPIRWDAPAARSIWPRPAGSASGWVPRKRCRRSCTGATPAPPAGTTSPSPSENWAVNWDFSPVPPRSTRSAPATTRHRPTGRVTPCSIAREPERPCNSTVNTGAGLCEPCCATVPKPQRPRHPAIHDHSDAHRR